MTTHPFLRTLTGKILLRLAGGGAVVLLLTSVFGTYVLYRQAEEQAMQRLADQVVERARLAEHVLHHTAETVNPLGATPVEAGLLVGGAHPALVDAAATRVMGFDPLQMAMIREALGDALLPGGALADLDRTIDGPLPARPFRAPRSWPSLGASR